MGPSFAVAFFFCEERMIDKQTARIFGTIYIALSTGLSKSGVDMANDVLLDVANSARTPAAEAEIYRIIAQSAGVQDVKLHERPRLELVRGGAA
jgi:hypothetical protein